MTRKKRKEAIHVFVERLSKLRTKITEDCMAGNVGRDMKKESDYGILLYFDIVQTWLMEYIRICCFSNLSYTRTNFIRNSGL